MRLHPHVGSFAGSSLDIRAIRVIRDGLILVPFLFMKTPPAPLRSPYEKMDGWAHLPRFVDKIRLHFAGTLPPDYQANFTKGFDGHWLEGSGVDKDAFLEVVRRAKNDAEVEAWVRDHIRASPEKIEACNSRILNRGRNDDASPRLAEIKKERGLAGRDDIQTFVDLIEVDEGRR